MIGIHCIWDAYNCDAETLSYVPHVEKALYAIIEKLNLSPVNAAFKQFEPIGVTGFILLEESHISIHTWPEHNYAAIDVFSCKAFDIEAVNAIISELFASDNVVTKTWHRGDVPVVRGNE